MMSRLPFAATGDGEPVVVLAGVYPMTGVAGDQLATSMVPPAGGLTDRRIHVINRFPNIPDGSTMSDLAAIHADALRGYFGAPVDLVGVSTGGSIAQQIAAEHPDVVRRLVLASTGYTLDEPTRREQAQVADLLDAGELRSAASAFVAGLVPGFVAGPAGAAAWLLAHKLFSSEQGVRDLVATLRAEDGFDLSHAPTITAPTLIVAGADDRYYPSENIRRTAELIPDAVVHVQPGRGHVSVLGDRTVAGVVGEFLT